MNRSWAEIMDPAKAVPYAEIKQFIETAGREELSRLEADEVLSTTQFVETLWPVRYCMTDQEHKSRKRLFNWLRNSDHPPLILEAWRRRGQPKLITKGAMRGKTARPWLWFNAQAHWIICPNCGCERKITKT